MIDPEATVETKGGGSAYAKNVCECGHVAWAHWSTGQCAHCNCTHFESMALKKEVPSFRNGKLTKFELDAMTPLQRQVLELVCDDCNWTSCFVYVFESPSHDGWTFKTIARSDGHVIECVHIDGSNRY